MALLALALFFGVRPYLGTLGYDPMALDSVYWLVRSDISNESWAAWTFGGPHFIAYRPVAALSFSLTSAFVGLDPLAYRIFDVLLHAVNGVLVFAVARRLAPKAPLWIGALAAALFLGHPASEEVVPWLARRHNALSCCFSLLAVALNRKVLAPSAPSRSFAPSESSSPSSMGSSSTKIGFFS